MTPHEVLYSFKRNLNFIFLLGMAPMPLSLDGGPHRVGGGGGGDRWVGQIVPCQYL